MSFNGNEGEGIPLDLAKAWTKKWRETKAPEDPNAFFFGREKLQEILNQEGSVGIRVYFGVNDENQKALILVGADADENDQTDRLVLDKGLKCPPHCPNGGGLNE